MKEHAESIDPDRVVERVAVKPGSDRGGGKSRKYTNDGDNAQRLFGTLFRDQRIDHHDDDAEDAQHYLRQDANVVNGRDHRPITCEITWVACAVAGTAACVIAENCLSAAETAGSMEFSHSVGA